MQVNHFNEINLESISTALACGWSKERIMPDVGKFQCLRKDELFMFYKIWVGVILAK